MAVDAVVRCVHPSTRRADEARGAQSWAVATSTPLSPSGPCSLLRPSFALQPTTLLTDQLSGSLELEAVRAGVLVSDPQIIPCIRS